MTLHKAIERLLKQVGRPMTTQQIASELNKNGWYEKGDKSDITDFQIHGRTNNYANLFTRNGATIYLVDQKAINQTNTKVEPSIIPKHTISSKGKDEHYVLDLCDKVLGLTSSRQHKFDFLLGDMGKNGQRRKLPVDSYYENLNLVIEYYEKQHTENVEHFDKRNKMTISGVHRGEQRKIYDERRRQVLPQNNIKLIEISYSDFNFNRQKRIIRDLKHDTEIVKQKLIDYSTKSDN